MEQYKYFAFISYSSKDTKWGKRVHSKLEGYRLPATLCSKHQLERKPIRPIFFAPYDIQPGGLSGELQERLKSSRNLIVICSPNSAKSQWVGKEIEYFHSLGRTNNIHFFIVDGHAHSGNEETECINPVIDTLGIPEILGANIHEKVSRWPWINKERAYVQLITKLLGVEFDSIWKRHKRILIEKCILFFAMLFILLSSIIVIQKRLLSTQVNNAITQIELLIKQDSLSHAYEIANKSILPYYDRLSKDDKYKSEIVLRKLISHECNIVAFNQDIKDFSISPDCKTVATAVDNKIIFWDIDNGHYTEKNVIKLRENGHPFYAHSLTYSPDGNKLLLTGSTGIYEYDISKNQIVNFHKMDQIITGYSAEYNNDGNLFVYSNPLGNTIIFNTKDMSPIDSISGMCPSFNNLGNNIIYIDRDNEHLVKIYNVENKQLRTFKCPGICLKAKLNIDNRFISVLCADYSVYILDSNDGRIIGRSQPSPSNIQMNGNAVGYKFPGDMVFDDTGNLYCATTNNSDIYSYILNDNLSFTRVYQGHSQPIFKLELSKDKKHLLSLSNDKSIRVWKLPSYMQSDCIINPMPSDSTNIRYSYISMDGKTYIKLHQEGKMEIAYDFPQCNSNVSLRNVTYFCGLSNDSRLLFCHIDNMNRGLFCFDMKALKNNNLSNCAGILQSSMVACSNKKYIVTADNKISIYNRYQMHDSISIELLSEKELHFLNSGDIISAIAICESNNKLVMGTQQGYLYACDVNKQDTPSLIGKLEGMVKSLSYNPNGKYIVCNIFNIQKSCYTQLISSDGAVISQFLINQGTAMFCNVTFSYDGDKIFQTKNDGSIYTITIPTINEIIDMIEFHD